MPFEYLFFIDFSYPGAPARRSIRGATPSAKLAKRDDREGVDVRAAAGGGGESARPVDGT